MVFWATLYLLSTKLVTVQLVGVYYAFKWLLYYCIIHHILFAGIDNYVYFSCFIVFFID